MVKKARTPDDLTISRNVGKNVRHRRAQRGMTQSALAAATLNTAHPLSLNSIMSIERGRASNARSLRAITVDELVGLSAALGTTPAALLEEPLCPACQDSPPPGFTCNTCHVAQES
ncbi:MULTISPECIES: helix-turn-helix domain-containing protein [Streptomyces]|uniref:helix-turn-helix domain-containing protein n=1 Tax=Streptomyces TaxID=1883 RepID=UPI00345BDA2E